VNYDTPVYLKTYVHRVGRTARAGRPGRAFTLLRHEECRHFKSMLKKAGTQALAHELPATELAGLKERWAAVATPLLNPEGDDEKEAEKTLV
jgi:ATP-dependent RNA helicase DDX51/DBP6